MARPAADIAPRAASATGVSPAARWIPANILRFYVTFSAPAETAFERSDLSLIGPDGQMIEDAFLILSEELWSPDGTRLTILMEPGRIKRGMVVWVEHPPALVPGRRYRLEVATGAALLTKTFDVVPAEQQPLDERRWFVTKAPVGTLHFLVLLFDRVMDAAIVADEVLVIGPEGEPVAGRIEVLSDGRKMRFHPERAWQDGEHQILFSHRLEDVCGNRLGEALDHAVSSRQRSRGGSISFRPPT